MNEIGIDLAGVETQKTGFAVLYGIIAKTKVLYSDRAIIKAVKAYNPPIVSIDAPLGTSSLGPAEVAGEKRETGLPDTVEARLSTLISDLQKKFNIDQNTALLEVKICVNAWATMRGLYAKNQSK